MKFWWPSSCTLLLVLYLTLWPDPVGADELPTIPALDKIIHALMLGGLASAYMFDYKRWAVSRQRDLSRRVIVIIGLAVAVFSIIDELAQGLMGIGRSAELLDLLADWSGVILASILAPPVLKRMFDPHRNK